MDKQLNPVSLPSLGNHTKKKVFIPTNEKALFSFPGFDLFYFYLKLKKRTLLQYVHD